jgi:hypothetical protein
VLDISTKTASRDWTMARACYTGKSRDNRDGQVSGAEGESSCQRS